jgi:hypothetical protein
MPYQVKKIGKIYKLYNMKKKVFVNINYKSKESALSAGKNFMRYRKEKPLVQGNKILNKK